MNPQLRVFDEYAGEYDQWFDEHIDVYHAQQHMLRAAVPDRGCGLEVGVGSGRFAVPFGIPYGIDPSRELAQMAKNRGIEVVLGEGEHLPYRAGAFDYVLMMTVICFLGNPLMAFREAIRVLVRGGILIVGFIKKDGEIAMQYRSEKTKGLFLRFARFWTVDEVIQFFKGAGFSEVSVVKRAQGFCVMNGRKQ